MKITIFGDHTAPYGDHPYDQGREFEGALKGTWPAVQFFKFNSISAAEVSIDATAVADMTVRQVHARLAESVQVAGRATDWDIWTVEVPEELS